MLFGGVLLLQLLICAEFELTISCETGRRDTVSLMSQ